LYSQFLLGTQQKYSAVFLASLRDNNPAHDTFTRWLSSTKLQPHIIWEYSRGLVEKERGFLIVDDTVLDKWYANEEKMGLVQRQYSGLHHRIVQGIGIVSLLWNSERNPEEAEHITTDFRIYSPQADGKTKNQHCRDMLMLAQTRGFTPKYVLMDAGYADVKTFKLIRSYEWIFISGLEKNRLVSLTPHEYTSVADIATGEGIVCHLKAFGFVKVFKIVQKNQDIRYLVTNDVSISTTVIRDANDRRWRIEEYHRGVKQATGEELCQARNQRAQRNHILCSILAFLALEKWRLETGVSWYEAKIQIVSHAIAEYLKQPTIPLPTVVP